MNTQNAQKVISQMSRETFWRFLKKVFTEEYKSGKDSPYESFESLDELPLPAFQGIYRSSIYTFYEFIYLLDFLPYQIFRSLSNIQIDYTAFEKTLNILKNRYPYQFSQKLNAFNAYDNMFGNTVNLEGAYLLNNFCGYSREDYEKHIFTNYGRIFRNYFPDLMFGYGNTETFLSEQSEITIAKLQDFLFEASDGIVIQIENYKVSVNEFFVQEIVDGVTGRTHNLLEIGTILKISRYEQLIQEFTLVIENGSEAEIESFLRDNYTSFFGNHYDQISTQILLKFPELDLNEKDRRLDIFLRNAHSNDWELFEIKKDLIINTHYRDIDTFVSSVYKAIEQIRNYRDLLAQDKVKQKLRAEGIEYFTPVLNLVIGRTPQINHASYRRLIENNSKDVKIITYDNLLKRAESNLNNYKKLLDDWN